MIVLVVDGKAVAIGPDWMRDYFLEVSAERFPGKTFFIKEVSE